MKLSLTFKSPDAVSDALHDAGLTRELDEYDEIYGELREWFRYGEYINLEYDTETKQMRIVKP